MSKGRGCNKVKQIKYIWRVFATVSIIFGRGKLKTKTILGGFVSFFSHTYVIFQKIQWKTGPMRKICRGTITTDYIQLNSIPTMPDLEVANLVVDIEAVARVGATN